jgi:RNA polymerase sigma factor (sigma-70 family)
MGLGRASDFNLHAHEYKSKRHALVVPKTQIKPRRAGRWTSKKGSKWSVQPRTEKEFPDSTVILFGRRSLNVVGPNGPTEAARLKELMDRLCDELANLPERQAEAFWSRCVEGMSYAAIARQLETDTTEVAVLIHRAKLRLRERLPIFACTVMPNHWHFVVRPETDASCLTSSDG